MKKGFSLVVLVITIIVMIILAGTIIAKISGRGIINESEAAVFKKDIIYYLDELSLYKNKKVFSVEKEPSTSINASKLSDMKKYIPKFKEEHVGLVKIVNGKLVLGDRLKNLNLSEEESKYIQWLTALEITE